MRSIDYSSGLLEAQAQLASMETPTALSLRQNLQMRLANAEREIARVNELLQLLDRNPDIQRILELLGR